LDVWKRVYPWLAVVLGSHNRLNLQEDKDYTLYIRNQQTVRIIACNLLPEEADFFAWDGLCPPPGHSSDK